MYIMLYLTMWSMLLLNGKYGQSGDTTRYGPISYDIGYTRQYSLHNLGI